MRKSLRVPRLKTPLLKTARDKKALGTAEYLFEAPDVLRPIAFPAATTSGKRHIVDFQFYAPGAQMVKVVIGLTGSIPRHFDLHDLGGGAWTLRLLLSAGTYEYHFLVDDEWRPDPLARNFLGDGGDEKTKLVLK